MISKEDILKISYDIKTDVNDEQIQWIQDNYEKYLEKYPQDNWTYIVEIMIDDLTGPIISFNPNFKQ